MQSEKKNGGRLVIRLFSFNQLLGFYSEVEKKNNYA